MLRAVAQQVAKMLCRLPSGRLKIAKKLQFAVGMLKKFGLGFKSTALRPILTAHLQECSHQRIRHSCTL